MSIIRRAAAFAGYTSLAATGGWFWYTRQSHFGPLSTSDYLYNSTFFARYNPEGHPAMSDICMREVPLSKLKPEVLKEEGKLIEKFCSSVWGGIGFAAQRIILERSNLNEQTKHNLWTQPELASSNYPVGTEMVDHFEIISHTNDSIIVRCGGSPLDKGVRASDGFFELRAEVDEDEKVARFEMKSVFFSGAVKSEQHLVPWHIVKGHELYTKLLMETAVRQMIA